MKDIKICLIIYEEDNMYIAQGIEYDFASQGKALDDALDSFERLVIGQIYLDMHFGIEPLSDTPSFDEDEWEEFFEALDKSRLSDIILNHKE